MLADSQHIKEKIYIFVKSRKKGNYVLDLQEYFGIFVEPKTLF